MKYLAMTMLLTVSLIACAGWQMSSTENRQSAAYLAGRGVGAGINLYVPELDAELGTAWDAMIARNQGKEYVSSEELIGFYNDCVLILAKHVNDPYGLLGDLAVFTSIYGGQFNADGDLVAIEPVELIVLKRFELGSEMSKNIVLRKKEK